MNNFYSQQKKRTSGEEYTYYQPYCKPCASRRSYDWEKRNPDKLAATIKRRSKTKKKRDELRKYSRIRRENGKHKAWMANNKGRLIEYRNKHKKHDINKREWNICKEYFDNSCAYCGLHIDEHFIIYAGKPKKTDLHKEHVEHEGSNDISNCVPSCRDCNSSKRSADFEEWYRYRDDIFDEGRYMKIMKWLKEGYKLVQETE